VSRFRRALAAMALATAAASGALLTSAAGAAPAYAATPAAPTTPAAPAAPAGGHTITITAHAAKQAPGGISSQVVEPCAIPASTSPSQSAPASCLPPQIICWITVPAPFVNSHQVVFATASVHCDNPVDAIRLTETLSQNNSQVDEESDNVVNFTDASTFVATASCQSVRYDNFGFAGIDFPDGYTDINGQTTGSVHHLESFTPTVSACAPPPPPGGGGGGGGGCAITSPSSPAHPAADRPRAIVCP
jgi:hypothetical protein